MKTEKHDAIVLSSDSEKGAQGQFTDLLTGTPLPDDELLANLGLYMTSKNMSRMLFFYEIYKMLVDTHGVIMEFGVRWGQTLSMLSALRGIFEPFNRHRKIIGFDTFDGFVGMEDKDGANCRCTDGSFGVADNYEDYLAKVMTLQEELNPISHLKKFELVKGDARETIPAYIERHPETLVSLAIFDFDIYSPTKAALEAIAPRLFKGSILVFDELCDDIFPGETVALLETMGVNGLRIKRMPMTARVSYAVVE
ncbi:class I SAM-dependent methyltransferase [Pseudodesulfovibrio sp. zrk46]|uniref:class I SAM-dependent methyltransferase n=1 Tax=Pseudodesulfovibrio sp. zrk46 TaxID=2725288 RepID=UPI001448E82B|nr:class I SAM-dependent methyltransferase [Pseudodesulfovibrio sp. zrk46]QJB55724.1 class I SAM-dependent methyltransferase [Pseudodesulfovibrio sp. zrk46]